MGYIRIALFSLFFIIIIIISFFNHMAMLTTPPKKIKQNCKRTLGIIVTSSTLEDAVQHIWLKYT